MFSFVYELIRNTVYSLMNIFGFSSNRGLPPSNTLQVYVRTNVGEQVSLTLKPSWTVHMVKSDLAKKLNCSVENLKIIFAGKELPDNLLIEQCDLGNRSILHAVRVETRTTVLCGTSTSPGAETTAVTDSDIKNSSADSLENKCVNRGVTKDHQTSVASPDSSRSPRSISRTDGSQTKLLCDPSTVMTIQLTDDELRELQQLKANDSEKPHFYVYCIQPCASVRIGKLRVRCWKCKDGALILHRDPASWPDVLVPKKITSTCENPNCDGTFAEFYFKCKEHETMGEGDTAVALYLIRTNLPGVPCLACTDVSSPIVVFQCASAHIMCLDCFVTYCISRLNERQFVSDIKVGYTLPCPVGCSDSLVEEIHHFKLMGEQHYERYQRFGAEEALLAAGGVLCPRPGCGQGIIPDEDCRRVKCVGGCDYVFCKDCLQGYHIGECSTDNPYYYSFSSSSSFALNPDRIAMSSWDEASSVTIRVMTKPCPKCRTPTERDGGCMHMVCTRASCQFNWCWVCQTEWTRECMAAHWFG